MSPDAVLFTRLVGPPPPEALPDIAEAAEALTSAVQDTTDALREASSAMAALRAGRRGAAERMATTLARLELHLATQNRRTRDLLVLAATPPA